MVVFLKFDEFFSDRTNVSSYLWVLNKFSYLMNDGRRFTPKFGLLVIMRICFVLNTFALNLYYCYSLNLCFNTLLFGSITVFTFVLLCPHNLSFCLRSLKVIIPFSDRIFNLDCTFKALLTIYGS